MSQKTYLTFATLGVALVALLDKATPETKPELEAFKKDFDELVSKHDADLENLQADYESLVSKHDNVVDNLDEATEFIDDLKAKLEAALEVKAKTVDKPTITIEGVIYQVNHGSHPHSAEQISQSEDIAKAILKIDGQKVLTPVE
jgi:uncharacterized protein with von Willebrand factor type A (vWA) domain